METDGGVSSETRLVMMKYGKQKSMTGISASLTPDYRDKEESSHNKLIKIFSWFYTQYRHFTFGQNIDEKSVV